MPRSWLFFLIAVSCCIGCRSQPAPSAATTHELGTSRATPADAPTIVKDVPRPVGRWTRPVRFDLHTYIGTDGVKLTRDGSSSGWPHSLAPPPSGPDSAEIKKLDKDGFVEIRIDDGRSITLGYGKNTRFSGICSLPEEGVLMGEFTDYVVGVPEGLPEGLAEMLKEMLAARKYPFEMRFVRRGDELEVTKFECEILGPGTDEYFTGRFEKQ
jgi:hypothetical protein